MPLLTTAAGAYQFISSGGGGATTWDPSHLANGTLSGGNLTYTQSGATDGGTYATLGKPATSGKFYFEVTATTFSGSVDSAIGLCNSSAVLSTAGGSALNVVVLYTSGNLWANGSLLRSTATGSWGISTATVGVAVDMGTGTIWVTIDGSTWSNFSGTPAAGTGGDVFTAMSGPYFPVCFGTASKGDIMVANFSGTGLVFGGGLPPTGFTGWV